MGTKGLSAAQKIVVGFFSVIMIGAVILSLPISTSDGRPLPFMDGLFTSTTSVCVTGLVTVTVAEAYNLFGKIIILLLIQLGGLGVVCCAIGAMTLFRQRIHMKERMLIQSSYGLDSPDGLVRFVRRIIKDTFIIEGIGAFFYAFVFIPEFGIVKGGCYSVFHAISAFCNAGIDLIGADSFMIYRDNILINLTTASLIILGGIGYIVLWDIKENLIRAKELPSMRKKLFQRLKVHSKLALVMTFSLLILGTVLIFVFEYTNPKTIGDLSLEKKIMSSFFESVTTRTAGFATIPQENFRDSTYIIILIMMFIGASPLGTAGGIKTTTIAMLFLTVVSEVKGSRDVEVFKRKISSENIRTALAVVLLALSVLGTSVITLVIIEDMPLKEIVFECVSAMATVGLGRGNTANFSVVGKLIVCMLMFVGRIGPITLAVAFANRKEKKAKMGEKATARIMVG